VAAGACAILSGLLPNEPAPRVAIALLLCLGFGLRWANLGNVDSRSPDESVYTAQAGAVLARGTEGLRGLVAEYQRTPELHLFPAPTRAGYIWLAAGVMRLSGVSDARAGAYLSAASSAASLLLLAWVGLRFFPPWATAFALLFYAVSPPELAMARRAWQDCPIEFLGLALIWTGAEIVRGSRRRSLCLLFALIAGAGVTMKESWVVACFLWTACVLWALIGRKDWKGGLTLAAAVAAGAAASLVWLAHQVGSLSDLLQIVGQIPRASAANPYDIEYQTGPGYLLLQAFWSLAPIPALLCLPGLAAALFRRRLPEGWRPGHVATLLAVFSLAFLAWPVLAGRWLNLRYVAALYPPVYLLAGLGFWLCASACWARFAPRDRQVFAALTLATLLLGASTDYQSFRRVFVRGGAQDLSVKMVLDSAGR